jgi:hypothetical protein
VKNSRHLPGFSAGTNFSENSLRQIHRIVNITSKLAMSQNGKSESVETVRYRQMHTDSKLSKIETLDCKSQSDLIGTKNVF